MNFDKIIDIINKNNPKKEIILLGYDIDDEELYESSSHEACLARKNVNTNKHDIYLNALDEYNKDVEPNKQIKYWIYNDEKIVEFTNKLYDYVDKNFKVIIYI